MSCSGANLELWPSRGAKEQEYLLAGICIREHVLHILYIPQKVSCLSGSIMLYLICLNGNSPPKKDFLYIRVSLGSYNGPQWMQFNVSTSLNTCSSEESIWITLLEVALSVWREFLLLSITTLLIFYIFLILIKILWSDQNQNWTESTNTVSISCAAKPWYRLFLV